MARWIPLDGDPIVGDVIRWRETLWKTKGRKRTQTKIGDRVITAQVEVTFTAWVKVVVMHCQTTRDPDWWHTMPPELKERQTMTVYYQVLRQGGVERFLWGGEEGESVRGSLTSKFHRAAIGGGGA